MKSRYFLNIILRVILISLNCFVLIWVYMNTERPATFLFVFILLVIQTTSLIYYHNRIMRDLSNFLVFLEENDTTLAFSKKKVERSFEGLVSKLNRINAKIQASRIEQERQYHYLQSLVKQIDTGIISYDQDGKIGLFNTAARELLGVRNLKNISELYTLFPGISEDFITGKKKYSSALKITVNGKIKLLSGKIVVLKFDDQWIRILSIQNIRQELEAGELEAWRKLIRIQRHEIINSLTPITTLTTAIKRRFRTDAGIKKSVEITDEHIHDVLNSVEVIEERSKGLITFIERFKGITDLPGIKTETVSLVSLFRIVSALFAKELEEKGITLSTHVLTESLVLQGDSRLLEQVLINMVKNAAEAINRPGGAISLTAFQNQNYIIIQIKDNGVGIDRSNLESIFVPSFTTKESGSGIGLSISRQIIQLHKGTIEVRSDPGVETVFEIILPG